MCHRLHTYRPLSKLCFTTVEKKQRTNVYSTVYLSRVRCCTAEQLSVAAAEYTRAVTKSWETSRADSKTLSVTLNSDSVTPPTAHTS